MRIKKESNIIKTIGITTDLSKITLNVNSLNSSITGQDLWSGLKKKTQPFIHLLLSRNTPHCQRQTQA
jgi:hypothetical protein